MELVSSCGVKSSCALEPDSEKAIDRDLEGRDCLFLCAFEKLRTTTISFVKSARLYGTTFLPPDGFS